MHSGLYHGHLQHGRLSPKQHAFRHGLYMAYLDLYELPELLKGGYGLGRFKFSPTHEDIAVCCNPNASKLMPYFVGGMWMKKKYNDTEALATIFYGPASIKT